MDRVTPRAESSSAPGFNYVRLRLSNKKAGMPCPHTVQLWLPIPLPRSFYATPYGAPIRYYYREVRRRHETYHFGIRQSAGTAHALA